MLKVIRPQNVKTVEAPVRVPDAVIVPKPAIKQSQMEMEDIGIDLDGVSGSELIKIREFFDKEKKRLLADAEESAENTRRQADEIIGNANSRAEEIIEEAERTAQEIISKAERQGAEIKIQAERDGLEQGRSEIITAISSKISELTELVDALKIRQQEQYSELCGQLKYFAVDIAEKVVNRKIDEDDGYLTELVKAALSEVRCGGWITVEVSDKLSGLVRELREEQSRGEIGGNVGFEQASEEKGSLKLLTEEQIIDLSIPEQLGNIRKFFDLGDEKDDEEL